MAPRGRCISDPLSQVFVPTVPDQRILEDCYLLPLPCMYIYKVCPAHPFEQSRAERLQHVYHHHVSNSLRSHRARERQAG